ncbi:restriction endonuclease subunit S [Nostoc sp.]
MSNELPLGGSRLVPEGWTLYSIDEIKADEKYSCVAGPFGSSISSKYFTETGVPIIRGNNLKNNLTKFVAQDFAFVSEERAKKYLPQHVKAGDLVFTCWGTIGQVGLIPQDGPYPEYIISNKQLKLRVNPDLANNLFVFYYLSSKEGVEHIRSRAIGSAVPGINLGILKSIKIALPSLSTQQSITDILSNYDRFIDNNNRRIALLEESIHLLYKEWFVRSRFPGYESVKVVDGIPEGWKFKKLEELGLLGRGKSKHRPRNEPSLYGGKFPFIQTGEVKEASLYITNYSQTYNEKGLAQSKLWDAGTLLITIAANIAETAILTFSACFPDSIVGFIADSNQVSAEFIKYSIDTIKVRMRNVSTGAAQDNLSLEKIRIFNFLVPDKETMQLFTRITNPIFLQMKNLLITNENLRQARDLLLPRLMNGSIAV